MAYGFEDEEYYYDPAAETAAANTTMSGIGDPAASTMFFDDAPAPRTVSGIGTPTASTTASTMFLEDDYTGRIGPDGEPERYSTMRGGDPRVRQRQELEEFERRLQDPIFIDNWLRSANKDVRGTEAASQVELTPGVRYQIRDFTGNNNGKIIASGSTPEELLRLQDVAQGLARQGTRADYRLEQVGGPDVPGFGKYTDPVSGETISVIGGDLYNKPIAGQIAKIAIPVALAVLGGIYLGPAMVGAAAKGTTAALGLAGGAGIGSTAGNLLVGQPLDQSLISGLTTAATAFGGAGLGPIIGAGSVGVGAGAAGANLAANVVTGKSFEDSLKSAAIAGVTAGVMHALTTGGAGKTGDFTKGELRAAEAIGTDPVVGQSMNLGGQLTGPSGLELSLEAARLAAAFGVPAAGIETAITVTASSLSSAVPGASAAAISNAVGQAFQSVNNSEVAKAKEDATAKARQEEIARMGSDSDAKINARQAGFPEGYEVIARGSSAGNAVIGDAGAQVVTGLRGDVIDQNGNVIARNWFDLSDADKAALVAKAKADAAAATVTSTATGGPNVTTGIGNLTNTGGAGGTTIVTNTATNNDAAANAAAAAAAATGGGGGGTTQTVSTDRDTGTTVATGGGGGGGGGGGDGGTTPTVTQPRTRTVSSILDLGTPQEVLSARRIRELLGLPAGIGSEAFEVPLELETPYDVRGERIRTQIGLPAGLGTTFVDDPLDLGPREIRVTGRRTPIRVSAVPGRPRTLSQELDVPSLDDLVEVVRQRNILSAAPVITPATTARANINVKDQDPITVTGSRIGLPIGLSPNSPLITEALRDTGGEPAKKRTVLSTLKQVAGLTPLISLLADAVGGGGGGGGGTIDTGPSYSASGIGGRIRNPATFDPFTYGQRAGEFEFFRNAPGTTGTTGGNTAGIGGTGATTGATGATATGTPGPAATAAEVQAAFPGYTNIRQDAQGRWFGEPIPGYTASGTPATGLRVTAGGTFNPTLADYQALNPGFESVEQNEAGEFVGSRTEDIPASPALTEAQVRARYPGYTSYQKDASGQWTGTKGGTAGAPLTLEQVRAANPGYDNYEQDASGQWFGIRNPTTTAGRAATEADARAQNPGYDAYTKDANGQWVGIKNIAATTSGLLTEAQVRAANPGYSAYEKDASGQWVGIKNIETRTPRATTLDQVRAQYGANYDTITQNEAGKFIGTKTIPGQDTSMTLDQIRAAFPQYNRIEQLPTGDYVGITDVTEEVPFTLAQAQERFGSTYSNIRPGQQGQYIGTRTATRPVTLEDVRGLGLGYSDFEQDEAGNFYGITNVETRTPRSLTLADYQAKFGPQYSEIRQNPQGQYVGIGTRQTQVLPTIADAQRQYGSAYDAFEQGEGGIYGIRNEEARAPGTPFTLADAQARFGSQYSNIYQNDQGQFVGERTETEEPNMAEGGEVSDDMVRHLVEYRKGGGHMGPGQVKGIGSGQEDKIPAWLSDGEYVWSAQDVADLGDGSTDEGVRRLDRMRKMVRQRAGRKDVKKIAKPQRGIEDMLKAVGGAV